MTLAGCGGGGESSGGGGGSTWAAEAEAAPTESGTVTFKLDEMNSSGTTATVEMFPGAASTEFTLELQPGEGRQPADPRPQGDVRLAVVRDRSRHRLHERRAWLRAPAYVLIGEVATGEYVLDIHSATKPDEVIACGVIPEQ